MADNELIARHQAPFNGPSPGHKDWRFFFLVQPAAFVRVFFLALGPKTELGVFRLCERMTLSKRLQTVFEGLIDTARG